MNQRYQRFIIPIAILIIIAVWIVWPNSGIHINRGSFAIDRSFTTHLGLDLVGGVQALLEADVSQDTAVSADSMRTARTIVENRVNGLGVTESVVQQAGDRRIVVELPGEKDPDKALATLKQTGLLEFVDFTQLSDAEITALLSQDATIETNYNQSLSSSTTPTPTASVTSTITSTQTVTPTVPAQIFTTVMTGKDLKQAFVSTNPQTGEYEVSFELSSDGAKTFSDFTSTHLQKTLAIVLDRKIISAPRIQSAITDGKGVITGNFDSSTANALAVQLRYGALPIPLKVVTSQSVGPTLGQDSLDRSLVAGIIGLIIVMLFMALYYRLPGLIADLALLVYALLAFAIFKLIPVTLTLPGIAGFVLSIGVAVDANILIFERLKEEIRAGRTLRQAIDLGWERAWPSIRDSNFSTLITCLILYIFGSTFGASIVKGFAITLAIGVGVSMFTAIIVTRTFLHMILDRIAFTEHQRWFAF